MLEWKQSFLSLGTLCAGGRRRTTNVAELLTVVALRKAGLSSVCLNLDGNVAEAVQLENFLGSRSSG
jgi:hypothetical protein